MSETFNFREPKVGEVESLGYKAQILRNYKEKYKILSHLLGANGTKEIDITNSKEIYEAINREKMDFETIMNLHPAQVAETIKQVEEDRRCFPDGKWWNRKSKAKWGLKGLIPICCYYARPDWYWKDEKLVDSFFNTFPKLRISTKPL